jgi:hypothetical protein
MPPLESDPAKEQRLKLLELLYVYSTCPEDEKAEARALLYNAVDEFRKPLGESRQKVIDYLRAYHFRDYYKMRKKQERGDI